MGVAEVMYSYGLCLLSIVLIIFIAYLSIKINKSNLRQWCILILTCALITNISIMFQIVNISNIGTGIWYEAFCYIGITILPICQFFAIAYFLEPNFKFKKKYMLLFYIPIITIISMFTNSYHELIFKTFSTNYRECEYGILFYINLINMYATYGISLVMLMKYLSQNIKEHFNQITLGLFFIFVPFLIHIVSVVKLLDVKTYINGIVQSLIAISTIYISLKYQILTQIPISLTNILNTISDAFVVINKKGEIVVYNKVFLGMYNLGKLNIKKMDIKELIEYREFDSINEDDINNILSLKNESELCFERVSNKLDKTLKYEAWVLSGKRNKLYLISIADITHYSKNIQNIKLNHDAILGRERLASLGQMIGGIAHNLKTPIFSIAGAIEGIEDLSKEYKESIDDKTVTIEDHKEIAKEMLNWTDKIKGYLSYMTDIITAIQMQTANNEQAIDDKFSIKELIKYINILMKYELKQSLIELKVTCQVDEEKVIKGNINCLVQIINNLISNAIQAYNGTGNQLIELNIYEKEKNIYVEVRDYAGGIPKEVQNKLFKEMVTTKGKNGTGLRIIYLLYKCENSIWRKFDVLFRRRNRYNI